MIESGARASFYVLCEGCRGQRRPVSVCTRASRSGIKVRVAVEDDVVRGLQVFLLYRRGDGDMVLAASWHPLRLEAIRRNLGPGGDAYEIAAFPVVCGRPQNRGMKIKSKDLPLSEPPSQRWSALQFRSERTAYAGAVPLHGVEEGQARDNPAVEENYLARARGG